MDEKKAGYEKDPKTGSGVGGGASTASDPEPIEPPPPSKAGWTVEIPPPEEPGKGGRDRS